MYLQQPGESLTFADEALHALNNHRDSDEVFMLVHFYRYRVLIEFGRDRDAEESLALAYQEMMRQADAITDTVLRESFLTNVRLHQEIALAWQSKLDRTY